MHQHHRVHAVAGDHEEDAGPGGHQAVDGLDVRGAQPERRALRRVGQRGALPAPQHPLPGEGLAADAPGAGAAAVVLDGPGQVEGDAPDVVPAGHAPILQEAGTPVRVPASLRQV